MQRLLTFFFSLIVVLASTAFAADQDDEAGIAYFERHIRPLFIQHCYQCHSRRAKKQEGELLLDHRDGWLSGGSKGPSIVPGEVDSSLLIQAIRYSDRDFQMPPSGPLPADAINRIEHWIRIGAPGPATRDGITSDDPSDPIAGKSHWAFRSLDHLAAPDVLDQDWPRTSIDRFVLARLEKKGLRPLADANRRDLIRRVHVQLTGLPPSTELVQEFVSDDRPDAMERLVDRLLASPGFGERWGRHWLDLARFADSNGLDENFLFREAWRYRNWVISAVNAGMPFDRFILEQIAGDLLPFESIAQRDRQRIASGFLVIGPKVLLGNDERNQRMEVADELIDTVGRTILGQTLGCARCHDHKFDPIPTADYYALAGIFASTSVMETRYMLGEQRRMERLVGIGTEGNDADDAYEKYWRELPQLNERKNQADAILEALKQNQAESLATLVRKTPDALADGAGESADNPKTLEQRIAAQEAMIAELARRQASPPSIPPRAMIATDIEKPTDEHIRLAGQFDRLGDLVPRGMLTVLCEGDRVKLAENESGRLALANWLTDGRQRSGQLAARVLANRIWYHLIGRGLVRTVDNFGRTGEAPSHPELLDHLANKLIESGWSMKGLIREIVLSRTFALGSHFDQTNHAVDPDNRLLWRANRRRLDAESYRDALLMAAGQLDLTPMDSTVSYLGDQATAVGANTNRRRTDFPCRSVYLPVIRNDLPDLFEVFDFANPHLATGTRPNTTTPNQGLFLLNNALIVDAAEATARRILAASSSNDLDARIDLMFQLILNEPAAEDLRQSMRDFLIQTEARLKSSGDQSAEFRALATACNAMFASSRFQYLE